MAGKGKKYLPVGRGQPAQEIALQGTEPYAVMRKWTPYVLMAVTAIIYSRAVFFSFTNMDDDAFILHNPLLQAPGWDGIMALFTNNNNGKYQPLILLTYMLEYRTFGFNAVVFHAFSLFLHLANILLVYNIARQLSGKVATGVVVGALFALHPMHVEEVAWVSELKDTLPAFFYLLAYWYYLRYIDSGLKGKYYIMTALFFLVSLFSKSACITLPAILLLTDVYKGRALDKRAWIEKIPLILFSLLFFILGLFSKNTGGELVLTHAAHSFINRVFLFSYVPSFYVVKLIAPFHLAAMHYYPHVENGYLPWIYYASLPFLLGAIYLVVRRSSFRKELVFGVLFFAITIAVMEQIVAIGPALTPERYTYIPYFGFFYIIGQWLSKVWETKRRRIAEGLFLSVLVLFGAVTYTRIAAWKDDETIFGDTADKNAGIRDAYYPYFMLAKAQQRAGKLDEALQNYTESISLYPDFPDAYVKRGKLYFRIHDPKSAMADLNAAIAINPRMAEAYTIRAAVKANASDFNGAVYDYTVSLQLTPDNKLVYSDRGMARLYAGDTSGACADLKKSLELGNEDAARWLQTYCPR